MTRDQNGTWEMESNDNFEGYMKALGKGETSGGGGGELWENYGPAIWTVPPWRSTDLCANLALYLLAI